MVWRFILFRPVSLTWDNKEITVQDIPDLKYRLVLFVGREAIDLHRKANWTWAPVQHPFVLSLLTAYNH